MTTIAVPIAGREPETEAHLAEASRSAAPSVESALAQHLAVLGGGRRMLHNCAGYARAPTLGSTALDRICMSSISA